MLRRSHGNGNFIQVLGRAGAVGLVCFLTGAHASDIRFERVGYSAGAPKFLLAAAIMPPGMEEDLQSSAATDGSAAIMALVANKEYDKALEAANQLTKAKPDSAVGYNLVGIAYAGKGDNANARKNFEKALSLQKDYGPARMNVAYLDLREGKLDDARKRYESILANDPKNIPAMVGMSRVERLRNNSKESIAWLEKAKAENPNELTPRLLLALYNLRLGNHQTALAELRDTERSYPNDPRVLSLLGDAQLAAGQKSQAVATYRRLVAAQPSSPVAYYQLAGAQASAGDGAGAEESLKKALELKPDYVDAATQLVLLQVRAKQYTEATKVAQRLQTQRPHASAGLALEGDILLAQKRYAQAAERYQKALAVDSTSLVAVKLHAAQMEAGKRQDADAALEQWLNDHPQEISARLYLAAEYGKRGEAKAATRLYEAVLRMQPHNLLALNNLAVLYQGANDPRAVELAESAYKLKPDSPITADTLGWILVQQGKTDRGLKLLQDAVSAKAASPELRYHLAVALAKSGDKARARRELEKLLATTEQFPQRQAAQAMLKEL